MELRDALLKVFLADLATRGWRLGQVVGNHDYGVVAYASHRLSLQLAAAGYKCTYLGAGLHRIRWSPIC